MKDSIFVVTYGDGRGYLIGLDEDKIVDQTATTEKECTPPLITGSAEGWIAITVPNGLVRYSVNSCS